MFKLFKKTTGISVNELQAKLDQNTILLDVRTPQEYKADHIPVAKNVPLDKIEGYKPKQKSEIFVICQSGMRSKKAAQILEKNGYDAVNVRGGMSRWRGRTRGGK